MKQNYNQVCFALKIIYRIKVLSQRTVSVQTDQHISGVRLTVVRLQKKGIYSFFYYVLTECKLDFLWHVLIFVLYTNIFALGNVLVLHTYQVATENIPDVKTHFPHAHVFFVIQRDFLVLGKKKRRSRRKRQNKTELLGLVLCCHFFSGFNLLYTAVVCTDSVTSANKKRPSGSLCPTCCTTGNYHYHHLMGGVFKSRKLRHRLGCGPCHHATQTNMQQTNRHVQTFYFILFFYKQFKPMKERYCSWDMFSLRHTRFDTSGLGCRRRPAVLFINICYHSGGHGLLRKVSPALRKNYLAYQRFLFQLPLLSVLPFCQFWVHTLLNGDANLKVV